MPEKPAKVTIAISSDKQKTERALDASDPAAIWPAQL